MDNDAIGTWYLKSNGFPITLYLQAGPAPGQYQGMLTNENGDSEPVDSVSFDTATNVLEFRRIGAGSWQWYRGGIITGVFVGRFSHSVNSSTKPTTLVSFGFHVTGWNSTAFDQDIVPRVFDVVANTNYRAMVRVDRNPNGNGFIGRFKVYATQSETTWSADGEELEYDIEVTGWDGTNLTFLRRGNGWTQTFHGTVSGKNIAGTFTQTGAAGEFAWRGTRANVLSYGLTGKTAVEMDQWQKRTRRQLEHLILQDNPAPLDVKLTALTKNGGPFLADGPVGPSGNMDRDDNPAAWPRNYQLSEFSFEYKLPNPYGPDPMIRNSHAWLAVPTAAPPLGGWRAVLSVNGHPGVEGRSGAWDMMDPTNGDYWYGEAFARRGYVVLALDISHRPPPDSTPLYTDFPYGNDPAHGNGPHPAIQASELPHDTDWEEDGERAWDAFRALDLLLSGQLGVNVDPSRLLVTGLSLGGEMTTIIGALDTRLTIVIPAGFSPDLNVMKYHGNHRCWQWKHADVCEYIDTSDYHALIAPRALMIQTGTADATFSSFVPPFAADKQVARRSRIAYSNNNQDHFLHFLEPYRAGELKHQYRVGDRLSTQPNTPAVGVQLPIAIEPPNNSPYSQEWQIDGNTTNPHVPGKPVPTLFDCVDNFWQ